MKNLILLVVRYVFVIILVASISSYFVFSQNQDLSLLITTIFVFINSILFSIKHEKLLFISAVIIFLASFFKTLSADVLAIQFLSVAYMLFTLSIFQIFLQQLFPRYNSVINNLTYSKTKLTSYENLKILFAKYASIDSRYINYAYFMLFVAIVLQLVTNTHILIYFKNYFLIDWLKDYYSYYFSKIIILILLVVPFLIFLYKKIFKFMTRTSLIFSISFLLLLLNIFQLLFFFRLSKNIEEMLIIHTVSKTEATMWTQIKVIGNNFGQQFDQASLVVGDNEQRVLKWTDTEVIFVVDPFNTPSGEIRLMDSSGNTTNAVNFKYIPL